MFINSKQAIGAKIKQQRKLLNLTQAELAERVNMHEKQLSRIEAGVHYPTLENFISIISILGLKLADFDDIQHNSPLHNEFNFIVRNSTDDELTLYLDVIKTIKKDLQKIK